MSAAGNINHKFRLDGRAVLVAGAGRGIGRACAVAMAHAGAQVWLMSRTQGELDAAVAEINRAGGKAHALVCDVTDAAAVKDAVAQLPRLDVLVNNAGTNIPEPFVNVSEANLDHVLNLNTRAMFITAQAAVKKCRKIRSANHAVAV
jgi:NAD(P)-dependent dehydrogenase (short-subunit alcohol dehydrogenase family)